MKEFQYSFLQRTKILMNKKSRKLRKLLMLIDEDKIHVPF